ncbi:MAG: hypothetical protein CSA96_05325 [Bacteroidetes bacterium]|nr:MAG: hypothetical protein CSA96_05325 [Bacteroidota bacterium]
MIYLFRVISDEIPDFCRDVVAEGSNTFLELHQTLQKNLGFDASQLSSFFISNEHWEKQQEITLIDMNQDAALETATMDKAVLEDYLDEVNNRMIYVFDFFSERAFYIELIESADELSEKKTPFVAAERGSPPPQLSLDLLLDEENPDSQEELSGLAEDPLNGPGNISLDDIDSDFLSEGMPEDF